MKLETKQHPQSGKMLCLDLGLRSIGWALFKYGLLTDYGVIQNPGPKKGQRVVVGEIHNYENVIAQLKAVINLCDFICAETLYTSRSQKGAIAIGFSWATIAFLRGYVPVNIILPKQLKQLVKPTGKVSKQEVANFVFSKHKGLAFKNLPDHITDAIAIYHAYEKEVS